MINKYKIGMDSEDTKTQLETLKNIGDANNVFVDTTIQYEARQLIELLLKAAYRDVVASNAVQISTVADRDPRIDDAVDEVRLERGTDPAAGEDVLANAIKNITNARVPRESNADEIVSLVDLLWTKNSEELNAYLTSCRRQQRKLGNSTSINVLKCPLPNPAQGGGKKSQRKIYTGPKGGKYYIKNKRKVYI